jgi:hypothetical protein
MVHGVEVLESIADIQTAPQPMNPRERSRPTIEALMTEVRVVKGEPAVNEEVKRPGPDLQGAPERIIVQHILISMAGTAVPGVTRTKEEAEQLANQMLEQARGGKDFTALVMEFTDDETSKSTEPPGQYRLMNDGVFMDYEDLKAQVAIFKARQEVITDLQAKVQAQELTMQQAQELLRAGDEGRMVELQKMQWFPRGDMAQGFSDTAFSLEVGGVGMAAHDPVTSPFGWHIIKRIK